MIHRVIQNSKLTNGVAIIQTPFIDNVRSPYYSVHHTLNSSCVVAARSIYSLCRGVVVFIGNQPYNSVVVQYDTSTCLVYGNLATINVALNQSIESSELIGTVTDSVFVELLKSEGDSRVWPVRIGANEYFKQDPEAYIAGELDLPDVGATAYMSQAYPRTFNYQLLQPYVITLQTSSPQAIDWAAMKSYRVSGAIIDAGRLFSSTHVRQSTFMNPKLPRWVEDITQAGLLYGFYFHGCATNRYEAQDEIYELSYIVRNWPASLGVWVKPEFTTTVVTNNMILNVYRDKLFELGLDNAIGIYTDRSTMNRFTWADHQDDWLLWLVDHCSSVDEFDTMLTPDFFRFERV